MQAFTCDLTMHRQFRKLLENATGISQYIIAIVLDIRGFTPFCKTVDSVEVATYIKQIYMKILDNYFSNASFYKPTGDGLLVVIRYDEESLEEVVNSMIESCLKLLEGFGELCKDEAMINFPTPSKIGIGITRGSACCITSKEKILDYSGRVLNLASRLMDIARPSGIVFDSSFGLDLLSDEKKEFFLEDTIYIRGIAEEEPITVYYTKKHTLIPDIYKEPIKEPKWKSRSIRMTLEKFKLLTPAFSFLLKSKPVDEKRIIALISFSKVKGFRHDYFFDITDKKINYDIKGKKYYLDFIVEPFVEFLKQKGAKEDTKITFEVSYPVK